MKALVFAAGIGSRLKPFTDKHPKALVDVDGKPMLARVIEKIVRAGITDIIVNVHHFADQIIDFLSYNDFGADITISDERDLLLDTGGGLRKALDFLDNDPVFIHNADILSDFNIEDMISRHKEGKRFVTLLTADRATNRKFVFDRHTKLLKGWINTASVDVRPANTVILPDDRLMAFNGVHVLDPVIYPVLKAYRPANVPFSITDFYIDICSKWSIGCFEMPDGTHWFDVGKPETLEKARAYMNSSHHND